MILVTSFMLYFDDGFVYWLARISVFNPILNCIL